MTLLKGDVVRLRSGVVGEVTEVWGLARTHARIQSNGRILLITDADVADVVQRRAIRSLERR
jgi:preprotein translocase subunit YajC